MQGKALKERRHANAQECGVMNVPFAVILMLVSGATIAKLGRRRWLKSNKRSGRGVGGEQLQKQQRATM